MEDDDLPAKSRHFTGVKMEKVWQKQEMET